MESEWTVRTRREKQRGAFLSGPSVQQPNGELMEQQESVLSCPAAEGEDAESQVEPSSRGRQRDSTGEAVSK